MSFVPADEKQFPITHSGWAILARSEDDLGPFAQALHWKPTPSSPGAPLDRRYLWTDDYVNLLAILQIARGGR